LLHHSRLPVVSGWSIEEDGTPSLFHPRSESADEVEQVSRLQYIEISTFAEKFLFLRFNRQASFHDPRVGYLVEFFVSPEFSIKILPLPGIHGDRNLSNSICIYILWNRSLNNFIAIKFSKHGLKLDNKPAARKIKLLKIREAFVNTGEK
jgi:hypothetical protein